MEKINSTPAFRMLSVLPELQKNLEEMTDKELATALDIIVETKKIDRIKATEDLYNADIARLKANEKEIANSRRALEKVVKALRKRLEEQMLNAKVSQMNGDEWIVKRIVTPNNALASTFVGSPNEDHAIDYPELVDVKMTWKADPIKDLLKAGKADEQLKTFFGLKDSSSIRFYVRTAANA